MKRSNRLVLLVGVFLAIIAFVGIAILLQGGGGTSTPTNQEPTVQKVVVALNDIALGSRIETDDVTVKEFPLGTVANSYTDPVQVVGRIARKPVVIDQPVTSDIIAGDSGACTDIDVPATRRAMSVQVDQVTGVGTVIKAADYVDMIVGFTADKFPVVELPDEDSPDNTVTVVSGLNGTSVKLLLQGMQVLCTLLPPAPAQQGGEQPTTGETPTTLTGQQQIVILSVTAQQSEIIKFAQMDGNMSLVLRSAADFLDPTTGEPLPDVLPDATSGMILRILVDDYGVLVPELVEAILPAQAGN